MLLEGMSIKFVMETVERLCGVSAVLTEEGRSFDHLGARQEKSLDLAQCWPAYHREGSASLLQGRAGQLTRCSRSNG